MSLFRPPKHRTFNYKPRFYDPEKERIRDIVDAAKGSNDSDIEATKRRIKRGMIEGKTGKIAARKEIRNSRTRLIMIIIFLFLITYLILNLNLESILSLTE